MTTKDYLFMAYQFTESCTNCEDCLTVCPLQVISAGKERPKSTRTLHGLWDMLGYLSSPGGDSFCFWGHPLAFLKEKNLFFFGSARWRR
jgi:ferredoxin